MGMITYKVAETRPDKTFRGTDSEKTQVLPPGNSIAKSSPNE